MSIDNLVKRLQNIMRQDSGVDGDAQRIAQIVWILFLKVYDAKEELWEFHDDDYEKCDCVLEIGARYLHKVNNGLISELFEQKEEFDRKVENHAFEPTPEEIENV